jgi:hypothetical protein
MKTRKLLKLIVRALYRAFHPQAFNPKAFQ